MPQQQRRILLRREENIAAVLLCVHPKLLYNRSQRGPDRGDISVAAHLGDEPPIRTERRPHTGENRILVGYPMERGVRKHRIEFPSESKPFPIAEPRVQPSFYRRLQQFR